MGLIMRELEQTQKWACMDECPRHYSLGPQNECLCGCAELVAAGYVAVCLEPLSMGLPSCEDRTQVQGNHSHHIQSCFAVSRQTAAVGNWRTAHWRGWRYQYRAQSHRLGLKQQHPNKSKEV